MSSVQSELKKIQDFSTSLHELILASVFVYESLGRLNNLTKITNNTIIGFKNFKFRCNSQLQASELLSYNNRKVVSHLNSLNDDGSIDADDLVKMAVDLKEFFIYAVSYMFDANCGDLKKKLESMKGTLASILL